MSCPNRRRADSKRSSLAWWYSCALFRTRSSPLDPVVPATPATSVSCSGVDGSLFSTSSLPAYDVTIALSTFKRSARKELTLAVGFA